MSDYYQRPSQQFLRDAPKNLARSAYAVEVNPWVTRGDIEAALLFRGTIVSAMGQIETSLGELALRCSRLRHYAEIREAFPYSLKKRIKFLRNAFMVLPLKPHEAIANQFMDRVENLFEMRNMAAHARMQVMPESGVIFHHFPQSIEGGVETYRRPITMTELERLAWKAAKLSRTYQYLANRLEAANLLPKLEI